MEGLDAGEAEQWLSAFLPEYEGEFTLQTSLTGPDMFTHSPLLQNHMPMHRIALDDATGSEYYLSQNSAEVVMKTSTNSRLLGFSGYNIHTLFFWRQQSWWSGLLRWLSWAGLLMACLGMILGIWRFSLKPVNMNRGVKCRTPYTGWYKWHHYAGLVDF